jgi:hypothetical protein
MSTATRIPMPLSSEEIRAGIVQDVKNAGASPDVCETIRIGLTKTCSLNRQSYSKFSVKWFVKEGAWSVDYDLDDFGRSTRGIIGGVISDAGVYLEGQMDPMPPDAFRRKTEQPVPAPQVVKPKAPDAIGISKVQGGKFKRKMV